MNLTVTEQPKHLLEVFKTTIDDNDPSSTWDLVKAMLLGPASDAFARNLKRSLEYIEEEDTPTKTAFNCLYYSLKSFDENLVHKVYEGHPRAAYVENDEGETLLEQNISHFGRNYLKNKVPPKPTYELDFTNEKTYDLGDAEIRGPPGPHSGFSLALRFENRTQAKLDFSAAKKTSMRTFVIGVYFDDIESDTAGQILGTGMFGQGENIVMHDKEIGMGITGGDVWNFAKVSAKKEKWMHVVAVFRDVVDCNLYVNGFKAPRAFSNARKGWFGSEIYIGGDDCWINEVKVYDRALASYEINALWFRYYHDLYPNEDSVPYVTGPPEQWLKDYASFENIKIPPKPTHEFDFSNLVPAGVELKGGAKIKETPAALNKAPGRVVNALRIENNKQYAKLTGIDTSPSKMKECTLVVGVLLESIAGTTKGHVLNSGKLYHWSFSSTITKGTRVVESKSHNETRFMHNRGIAMHDEELDGMGIALEYDSPEGNSIWDGRKVLPKANQWMQMVAVFREGGDCNLYVNGMKAPKTVTEKQPINPNSASKIQPRNPNSASKYDVSASELYIGNTPHMEGTVWCDCWVNEVKVYDRALNSDQISALWFQYYKGLNPDAGSPPPFSFSE